MSRSVAISTSPVIVDAPGTFAAPTERPSPAPSKQAAEAEADARSQVRAAERARRAAAQPVLLALAKPGITKLVTLTAIVGFVLGLPPRPWSLGPLLLTAVGCVVGTALSSAGANALNQWLERRRDGLMNRTALRPLPAGRISPLAAFAIGAALSLIGPALLIPTCGVAAAAVSFATVICYVLVYTPLKPFTVWNTIIGAVPGAMPPLIGWCAAATLTPAGAAHPWHALHDPGGWSLFLLMFVWQLPHFFAIAWMHREDYERGGFAMLPMLDDTGRLTAAVVCIFAVLLIPAALSPMWFMPDRLGWAYGTLVILSGCGFFILTLRQIAEPTRARARAVFLASIMHLPLLLMAMVAEALLRAWLIR